MIYFIIAAILIGIDQFVKYYISTHYLSYISYPIIPNVLDLTYIKNAGAAFGILQNYQLLFIITTIVAVSVMIFYFIISPKENRLLRIALILIISGGIGNLIDRIRLGYVTDFIDFKIWAVFNLADSFVFIGCVLLVYYILFLYKDRGEGNDTDKLNN